MRRITALLFCCALGLAQHPHPAGVPQEKPVALYPGLGIWTHPIATSNPQAQKFFDQGLALLYGFNRYEALRSFRKALEIDPHAAMAHWGISTALGPYLNMDMDTDVHLKESCEAAMAGLRAGGITPADRAWLEAAAARCPDYSDPAKYTAAMRALAARYPDDPDAQTWYAESLMLPVRWRWYSSDGKPAQGEEEAERVLEGVLRRYPNHPGANHFYIHAVESSPTPERAVPSAQRLMGIVPAAGHLFHMPGHIWLVLGEYQTAVDVNERAAAVDRDYFARTGVIGAYYALYLHNLDFIRYARSMQGRVAEVKKASAQLKEANAPMSQMAPEFAGTIESVLFLTEVRNQQWDAILAEPRPKLAQTEWIWRYSRAQAMFAKGRTSQARAEQAEFEKIGKTLDRNSWWGVNKLGDVAGLASAVLDARLSSSPETWRKAVELQDRLAYDEPPAWYYPVRESLGASLLASGDAPGAEEVFREGLRRSPHNGRMLFGLLESLKAQNKTEAAAWVQREFDAAWKGADLPLRLKDL